MMAQLLSKYRQVISCLVHQHRVFSYSPVLMMSSRQPASQTIEVERKFLLTNDILSKLETLGAKPKQEISFTDLYYDTQDFKLTLSDYWLRRRDEKWQLKHPPGSANMVGRDKVTRYSENEDDKEIHNLVEARLCPPPSQNASSVEDLLKRTGCQVFAHFKTTRRTFVVEQGDGQYRVDLDLSDFGHQVGEIETLVHKEAEIDKALAGINELAHKLGIDPNLPAPGKMDVYLKRNVPDLYHKLVQANICRQVLKDSIT